MRRRPKSKNKELELNVGICIEEELPDDPEILVSLSHVHFTHHSFLGVCFCFVFFFVHDDSWWHNDESNQECVFFPPSNLVALYVLHY